MKIVYTWKSRSKVYEKKLKKFKKINEKVLTISGRNYIIASKNSYVHNRKESYRHVRRQ